MRFHRCLPKPNTSKAPPAFYRLCDVSASPRSFVQRSIDAYLKDVFFRSGPSGWPCLRMVSADLQAWFNDPEAYSRTTSQP